jgi:hypothetical protein
LKLDKVFINHSTSIATGEKSAVDAAAITDSILRKALQRRDWMQSLGSQHDLKRNE